MSTAALFLLGALAAAAVASTLLWALTTFPRQPEPDYHERLDAIAPVKERNRNVQQPSGIVPLEPIPDDAGTGSDSADEER